MADRTVKVSLIANASQYIAGMKQAAAYTSYVGSEAEKLAQKREAFSTLGASAVAFGVATLSAVGLATKAAMDWESAWTGVTKTVDGSASEMAALEGELRGLAKTLPSTHEEIAAVAEAAGQLGVKRQDVAAFTKTMIDLGETTNLTADEAATSIAQLMNVMGTAPEEVDNLGASLVALGNDGASTERDIIQMAQRIAGAGKIIGLTEGEVMGFANALASAGIEVEAGGSAISRIMTDIAKSVSAGGDDLEGFAEVAGMSADDFAKAFKEAPAEAIATFIEGLGGINAAGGDVFTTLSDLGQSDIRVSQALLGMANSGDLLRKSLELGNTAWEENTALQTEAEKRYATTEAQLQIMTNRVNDAAITFGSVFLPAVAGAAEALGGFADFLGGLPGPVQSVIGILAVGAGAVALFGGAALLAVPKIAAFKVAMSALDVQGGRTGGALRGVAGFLTGPWGVAMAVGVTAFMAWDQANKEFQGRVQAVVRTLDEQTGAITRSTREFVANKLAQEGAYDAARKVGVSQRELVDAVLEGGDAYASVNEKLDDYNNSLGGMFDAATGNGINAIRGTRRELEASQETWTDVAAATGEATVSTEMAAETYQAAAGDVAAMQAELSGLIDTINTANGVGQDAVSANIAYQDALFAVDQQIRQAREGVEGFTLGMDQNTQAGRGNAQMLVDLARESQDAAKKQFDLDNNTANYRATLEAGRQAVIDRAQQLGATAEEAKNLADKIYAIPPEREFNMIANTAAAAQTLDSFIARYGRLSGTINYRANLPDLNGAASGAGRIGTFADGGAIRGAGGPRDDRVPLWGSNGEHMLDARDVQLMGGQAGVYRFREDLNRNGGISRSSSPDVPYARYAAAPRQYATAASSTAAATEPGLFTGQLYLDSGELLGVVRGEIKRDHQNQSLRLRNGAQR